MVPHDRNNGVRKPNGCQQVSPDVGMTLHLVELCGGQFSRLVQYVFRDCEFAHVVQQRGCRDCI
jgi:hypothetical protein